jgi:hypothetical protein
MQATIEFSNTYERVSDLSKDGFPYDFDLITFKSADPFDRVDEHTKPWP